MTDSDTRRPIEWAGWAGVLLTALSALVAITVQWGVVNTKLDNMEKRLDEMIFEARTLRSEYQSIERRLSMLEGQHRSIERINHE